MSTSMRDTFQTRQFWDESIAFRRNSDKKNDFLSLYQQKMPASETGSELDMLFAFYTRRWSELVGFHYNRGDDLTSIRTGVIDVLVNRYGTLVDEIERYKDTVDLKRTLVQERISGPYDVQTVYTLLSWLICFDVDDKHMARLAPYIAPEGEDRIIDTVLSRYQPGRPIADKVAFPRTHRLLDTLLDSDEKKRVSLATQYLERWGKLMSTLKGLSALGGAWAAVGAKSNDDLDNLHQGRPSFEGYWAWDLALLVRVLEIDDSSFADHRLYPSGLAHFKV